MIGILACASCSPKPAPNAVRDLRPCLLGLVPERALLSTRAWAPEAVPGDLLVNLSCLQQEDEATLLEIYRLTRPRRSP